MKKNNSMKIILSVSIVTIILFAQISNVSAINDQGLVWAVEVGDRFDYNIEVEFHNTTMDLIINDEMYVIINELSIIKDHVSNLMAIVIPRLPLGGYTTYWGNGTTMDSVWLDILRMGTPFVFYPIGNWSLLTQIFEDAHGIAEITQNSTGFNHTFVDFPNPGNIQSYILLKSNGVSSSYFYNVTGDSETTIFFELTMIQSTTTQSTTTSGTTDTTTGTGDNNLILILGGAATVVIVVLAIVIMRRK